MNRKVCCDIKDGRRCIELRTIAIFGTENNDMEVYRGTQWVVSVEYLFGRHVIASNFRAFLIKINQCLLFSERQK